MHTAQTNDEVLEQDKLCGTWVVDMSGVCFVCGGGEGGCVDGAVGL